jgi:predicted ATPase
MSFRLSARQYKSFANFDWAPEGVCVIVGPNGSGKTTALWTPEVLRLALDSDLVHALTYVGGSGEVRRFDAPAANITELTVSVGELSWSIRPERETRVMERVVSGAETLVERGAGESAIRIYGRTTLLANDLMALRRASNGDDALAKQLAPLVDVITQYRVHGDYELRVLRETGSPQSNDLRLDAHGTNAFAVLQRWRTLSDHEHRWEFVVTRLREAFPSFFQTFDFEPAGNVISVVVRTPQKRPIRPNDWPNGFFALLLSLTAVAGTNRGGVVAIDEPETSLHPALIRFIIEAFRDWAIEHDVTVLLATHSPVLLDCFKEQTDQVYVMEPGQVTLPVRLSDLKGEAWLRHFSIGDLYGHDEFGAAHTDGQ